MYWFCHISHESATGIHGFPILNPPPSPYHPSGSSQMKISILNWNPHNLKALFQRLLLFLKNYNIIILNHFLHVTCFILLPGPHLSKPLRSIIYLWNFMMLFCLKYETFCLSLLCVSNRQLCVIQYQEFFWTFLW